MINSIFLFLILELRYSINIRTKIFYKLVKLRYLQFVVSVKILVDCLEVVTKHIIMFIRSTLSFVT